MDGGRWQPPSSISTPFESKVKSAISGISRTNGFTDPNSMARESVLAIANDNDPTHLTVKYHFSDLLDRPNGGGKFINIACVEASDSRGDLPFEPALLVWGSGRLRESNVYLACAPLSSIESRSSWRYFSGMSLSSGPIWLPDEHAAIPLFDHRQVGELSVMRVEGLGVWLMTYNASAPRGINARVACSPWGPWSDPILLYDPNWPNVGYGAIMRSLDSRGGPCDPGREDIWGGEYGAYLIKRYTRYIQAPSPSPLRAKIYFVMSTWNPYNTVLMTAEILREPVLSS
jgi:hypothetical protein